MTSSMPFATTIFFNNAERITKSLTGKQNSSAFFTTISFSLSVQRIAKVLFLFLVSITSFRSSHGRGYGALPRQKSGRRQAVCYACQRKPQSHSSTVTLPFSLANSYRQRERISGGGGGCAPSSFSALVCAEGWEAWVEVQYRLCCREA